MPKVIAIAMPPSIEFWERVQRIWDNGDAVAPIAHNIPAPQRSRLVDAIRPTHIMEVGDQSERALGAGVDSIEGDALVMCTSGTSGAPKAVVLTHTAMDHAGQASTVATGACSDSHWLACLPINHIGGFSVLSRALVSGCALTIDVGASAESIDSHANCGATHVSLVAAHLPAINAGLWDRILIGGSRSPTAHARNITTTYGMTETFGGVVYDGAPLPGCEVRLDAHTADAPGSEDHNRRISLRTPSLLRCYRSETPFGTDPKSPDGWFATSDEGYLDEDGSLFVSGRIDDVIITGGHKVHPDLVESAIARLPSISLVAVIGTPHDRWGEVVTAVVTIAPRTSPPSLEEIANNVSAELPAYCVPRRMVIIDEMPTTELGKIRRSAVRDLVRTAPRADSK